MGEAFTYQTTILELSKGKGDAIEKKYPNYS